MGQRLPPADQNHRLDPSFHKLVAYFPDAVSLEAPLG